MEGIRSRFLWSGTQLTQRKYRLVSWDKVCRKKEFGGLGMRDRSQLLGMRNK